MNQLKILMAMLMLSLTACSGLSKVNKEIKSIAYHVKTLKEKGCAAVSKPALRLLVVLIKSRIDNYPENGVCDKNWVRDVLVNKVDLLESDDAIQNRPAPVGHQTDSGHANLVQPSAAFLLFQKHPAASHGTDKLQNRLGFNTKKFHWFMHPASFEIRAAAVIHDFIYTDLCKSITKKQADQVLYEAMSHVVSPAPKWKRYVVYLAVRIGGKAGW